MKNSFAQRTSDEINLNLYHQTSNSATEREYTVQFSQRFAARIRHRRRLVTYFSLTFTYILCVCANDDETKKKEAKKNTSTQFKRGVQLPQIVRIRREKKSNIFQ